MMSVNKDKRLDVNKLRSLQLTMSCAHRNPKLADADSGEFQTRAAKEGISSGNMDEKPMLDTSASQRHLLSLALASSSYLFIFSKFSPLPLTHPITTTHSFSHKNPMTLPPYQAGSGSIGLMYRERTRPFESCSERSDLHLLIGNRKISEYSEIFEYGENPNHKMCMKGWENDKISHPMAGRPSASIPTHCHTCCKGRTCSAGKTEREPCLCIHPVCMVREKRERDDEMRLES